MGKCEKMTDFTEQEKSVIENANNENGNTIGFITLASVISAISVVYLHANGCFWEFDSTARYWMTANVIESVFYFAVPVFFMISGTTLMDFFDRYDLKTYSKKRIFKTVIPYLFWSIVGYFYSQLLFMDSIFADTSLKKIVKGIISGDLVRIYWFFIPLFCIYVCIPLLAAVRKEQRTLVFSWIVIIAFVYNYLAPFIFNLIGINFSLPWGIDLGKGFLFYVLVGYLLSNNDLPKWTRIVLYVGGIIGLIIHMIGTYKLSMDAGAIVKTYKGYLNVPCMMYSVAIFVFMKNIWNYLSDKKMVIKAINFLSGYTFSLYLLHIFILWTIQKVGANVYSIYYRLLSPIAAIIITIILAVIIRKIPILKKVLP